MKHEIPKDTIKRSLDLGFFGITVRHYSDRVILTSHLHDKIVAETNGPEVDARLDGVESLILAASCAGVDIQNPKFIEAIQTAVDACVNND